MVVPCALPQQIDSTAGSIQPGILGGERLGADIPPHSTLPDPKPRATTEEVLPGPETRGLPTCHPSDNCIGKQWEPRDDTAT